MATTTPNLALTLLGTGESVGTWGIPLNNNFSKIDVLSGEIISARGSEADLNSRFGSIETEIGTARGVLPVLNDRLSVLLAADGTANINNFPKSTSTTLGVTRISVSPVDPQIPISVGDNDGRVLTQTNHDLLVNGGITALHLHTLDSISDVSATATEVNQVIVGVSGNVTAGNLNILTGGGEVPKSLMTVPNAGYNYTGLASLSVSPVSAAAPIAVGDNDTRILTQVNHDALISGSVTALHSHDLADGANDLTVTATILNQLTGAGATVTASNLDALTDGSTTVLHNHDNDYYTKLEQDTTTTSVQNYANAAVSTHNANDGSHAGANLVLGALTAESINQASDGIAQTIRSGATELDGQVKWEVKDQSGVSKIYATAAGEIVADKITTRIHEVVETTTLNQSAIATSNLTVDGSTILGDNNALDVLTCNVSTATFNGDVILTGGITVGGTVDGVDIATRDAILTTVQSEVVAARGGEVSILANIVATDTLVTSVAAEVQAARGVDIDLDARIDNIETTAASLAANNSNPHVVTLTQAIAADGGTSITAPQLETLSDGSNADALHVHTVTDNIIADALTSPVYGVKASLSDRLDDSEAILNGHTTEITNARGVEASVDARLDLMDIAIGVIDITPVTNEVIAARDGEIDLVSKINAMEVLTGTAQADASTGIADALAAQGTADTAQAEVTAARGVEVDLETRLDAVDTLTATFRVPYVEAFTTNTTFSVVHSKGTKAVIVQLRNTADDVMLVDADITSITMTDIDTVDIVIGTTTAVEVVIL